MSEKQDLGFSLGFYAGIMFGGLFVIGVLIIATAA